MKKTRIHMASAEDATISVCGWWHTAMTSEATHVTCKLCRRKLRKASAEPEVELTAAEERRLNAQMTATRIVRPDPQWITPEVWRTACRGSALADDRDHRCGRCLLCEQERVIDNAADVNPSRETGVIAARDPAAIAYRWPSVDAALEAWAMPSSIGPLRSATGTMLERAWNNLGPGSSSPNDRPMISAALIIAVSRAVVLTYSDPANRAGEGADRCTQVLRARYVGLENDDIARVLALPITVTKSIASLGRRGVRIELSARSLIRPPKLHDPLRLEIIQRQDELLRVG